MKDYHDYVIKEGKLVGKFEEMYKNCEDPWFQSIRNEENDIRFMISMLKKKYPKILELGCGLGYISNELSKFGDVIGVDISKTAIEKASKLYPKIKFEVCDLVTGIDSRAKASNQEKFDLIVLSGTLWYIVEYVDKIFQDIDAHLTLNGEFILDLPFPPLDENFYGKSTFPDEQSLIEHVKRFFNLITTKIIKEEHKPKSPTVVIYAKKREK